MQFFLLLFSCLLSSTLAQYPPSSSNLTTIPSPFDPNITISYKSPGTACKTVFSTQQQSTGWVHIPGQYPTNTFWWFIGARDPSDQLTIWINGGPGSSSMLGLFTENGPCEVVELAAGKLGTVEREWGWDRGSNLLYIDQVIWPLLSSSMSKIERIGGTTSSLGICFRADVWHDLAELFLSQLSSLSWLHVCRRVSGPKLTNILSQIK